MYRNDYKEKSNRRAAAILIILFFMFAYKCTAQLAPMKFSCGAFDTLYVSIADSVNPRITLKCSKHTHSDILSITIGFASGKTTEVFYAYDYQIRDVEILKTNEIEYILFNEQFVSSACLNVKTKDYFIKYFNNRTR